jgi:shikimate kinase
VVNALASGVGAAIGIELWVDAEVELDVPGLEAGASEILPPASATPIVQGCARAASIRYGQGPGRSMRLRLRSQVPASSGLKSSSAVGTATVLATARALGADPSGEEAARITAETSRAIGQSRTGAFDDNLASTTAGLCLTDNRTDSVLRIDPPPEDLVAVLWIPPGVHPPSPELAARFEAADPTPAVALLLAGRIWEAMEANSIQVEALLGLDGALRPVLRALGARAVGVSGLGPARAIIVPPENAADIASALPAGGAEIRTVRFRRLSESPGRP